MKFPTNRFHERQGVEMPQIGLQTEPQELQARIQNLLVKMAVNLDHRGAVYIAEILELLLCETEHYDIRRALQHVAKKHKIGIESARSTIRYTVKRAWENGDSDLQIAMFGNTIAFKRGKPTESAFIATLAMWLQFDLRATPLPEKIGAEIGAPEEHA